MSQNIPLDTFGRTEVGPTRENNEDNLLWYPPEKLSPEQLATKGLLYMVADGVGGHQAGEVASQMAHEIVEEAYYANKNPDVSIALQEAIETANRNIYREANSNDKRYGMASTITAIVLRNYSELTVANVGDSRTYLIRNGQVTQLSTDHSWVAAQVAAGVLTPEEAKTHPQRNVVTRSLGNQFEVSVDIFSHRVGDSDSLLLCSDGLSEVVSDAEMAAIVMQNHTAEAAVNQLVDLTYRRQGPDNVTALVVNIGHKKTVPASAFMGGTSGKQRNTFVWVGGAIALFLLLLSVYLLMPRKPTSTQQVAVSSTSVITEASIMSSPAPSNIDDESNAPSSPTPTKGFTFSDSDIQNVDEGGTVTFTWEFPIEAGQSYQLSIEGPGEPIKKEHLTEGYYKIKNLPVGHYSWLILVMNQDKIEFARSKQRTFTVTAFLPSATATKALTASSIAPVSPASVVDKIDWAPKLISPNNEASFGEHASITLSWSNDMPRPLNENEYYVLIIHHREGDDRTWLKELDYTIGDARKKFLYTKTDANSNLFWKVVVANKQTDAPNEDPTDKEVSQYSEERQFRWGENTGGGGGEAVPAIH